MPSLLDKVLTSKENPVADTLLSPKDDKPHTLSDGSVVYDSTIAAINRVFEINPHLYKKSSDRGESLYLGRERLTLSGEQILSLLRSDWVPKSDWQLTFFKEKVMEIAPTLSFDGYAITDYLFWDKETQTLKRVDLKVMC